MAMQPKEQRLPFNRAIFRRFPGRGIRDVFQPLVRTKVVIILNVAFYYSPQLAIGKNDEIVKAFFPDGTDKALGVRIHIRRIWHNADILETVFVAW